MAIPSALNKNLKLPVIVAPMFLVSGPELVLAACKSGVIGSLPALNHRTTEGYSGWLDAIEAGLGPNDAPYAVNLIVHKTNPRLAADLEVTIRHRVPLVITSLGAVRDVVDKIHGHGGLVFHDVTTLNQLPHPRQDSHPNPDCTARSPRTRLRWPRGCIGVANTFEARPPPVIDHLLAHITGVGPSSAARAKRHTFCG